jgi:methyl-accepting chemotaxis protein
MGLLDLLHSHPRHRARQLRWVLPVVAIVLVATLGTLAVMYHVSDQAIGTEFFRAHKTISHTGELLHRGTVIASLVLLLLVLALMIWAFRLTHRIVRPLHTLHRTLDALVAGDLGVRVELHQDDEFHEVGIALNRFVDEFASTLAKVHALVDRLAAQTAPRAPAPGHQPTDSELPGLVRELDETMEFFRLEPRHTIRENED